MDAQRVLRYVNLGSFRSNGSLYLADPTILPSSKSPTESVLLDAGITVGLFPIYRAGKLLVLGVSLTRQALALYQSSETQATSARFPFQEGVQ
jgi:hypothetical protein